MATIEFRRVPVVNGKAYASMDEFRKDAIVQILTGNVGIGEGQIEAVAAELVTHSQEIIEILTLNTRSRPQMRKDRKARKPRKQDATLPLPDNT